MSDYNFTLAPAYCLFNGVAISNQHGKEISFVIEKNDDEVLKERLKKAFLDHIESISKLKINDKSFTGTPSVKFVKGNRSQIRKYVSELYAGDDKSKGANKENIEKKNEEAAAVLLLDRILTEGRQKKATDIHIENKQVRFRINGQLETYIKLSEKRCRELIQRIKLLGGMNVLDRKKSQDGNFVYGNRNPLFIRVSSVSVLGENYLGEESVVLRLLDTSRIPLSIDYLGFNENQLQKISELEDMRNGLVLVCGPTGSGKSTTVASILVELEKHKNGKLKIISMEDPPEYFIPGVSQIKIENNYMEVLNHIFRLDPDVIMVGEIRDEVSASVALKAALTGHLVFATLHTGSVSESILRMENLGLDRVLLCSVLRGVICQELNYVGNEIKLYGDVGIPVNGFGRKINKQMGEEQLEEMFIHVTNYSEILSKTLEIFNKRNLELNTREKRMQKLWKGKQHGKVYKRIV